MSFSKKRDRVQILADILDLCKRPQTRTHIRRQTNLSHGILQSCITQLLLRRWLTQIIEEDNQRKLATTDRGMVFLNKWLELQKMIQTNNVRKLKVKPPKTQVLAAT